MRFLLLVILMAVQTASAWVLLPQHPHNSWYLRDLANRNLDLLDFDSSKTTDFALAAGWQESGFRFTSGLTLRLAPNLLAELWIDGTNADDGEALMGTNHSRGGWTGRIQHATLSWQGDYGLIEIGRRSLNQGLDSQDDLIWNQNLPGVDMLRYQLRAENLGLKLDVIAAQLPWEEDSFMKRWYTSHRLTWRSKKDPRNTIMIGDQAVLAGTHRGFELQMLNPLVPTIMDNFEGASETFADSAYFADSHILFASWNWWPSRLKDTRFYGQFALDEFQIDKQDRERLDDVYAFMAGLEHVWANHPWKPSLGLEISAATPWMYVHRGRASSMSLHDAALGAVSGADSRSWMLRGRLEPKKSLRFEVAAGLVETGSTNGDWEWGALESAGMSWPVGEGEKDWSISLSAAHSFGGHFSIPVLSK